MLFTSMTFLIFFIIVLALYWLLPKREQNIMLLAASYFFYGYWDWRFLSLILTTTVVCYICGLLMNKEVKPSRRKAVLIFGIAANLSILGFFKYYNFFIENFNGILTSIGFAPSTPLLNIILPVGISFYTFQALSYVIDVYWGKAEGRKNYIDLSLYVAFFPQLVAGPIERATHLLPQLEKKRNFSFDWAVTGINLIAWGFFKKLVIADNCAIYVDGIFKNVPGALTPFSGEVLLAIYAFALQIYCDFSAYSDIARGCAKLMGIDIIINFKRPYLATSFSDFWRRWHVSLSEWIRDYIYIPLGGSRCSTKRVAFNLILTMFLGGLWHGAAWTFVFWGLLHGIYLAVQRPVTAMFSFASGKIWQYILRPIKIFVVFQLVCFGWLLFRAESFENFRRLWDALLSMDGWGNTPQIGGILLVFSFALIVAYILEDLAKKRSLQPYFYHAGAAVAPVVLTVLTILYGASKVEPFIYFQF